MATRRCLLRQAMLLAGATALGGAAACSPRTESELQADPEPPAPSIVRGRVGESIDEFLAGAVPVDASLTVLAARDGEIVYGKGFGMADREAGVAAGLDTAYDIGSITKQFTASAILCLEVAGELATSDLLTRFLSVPPDKRGITLHHLLTHTSGLVDQLGDDYAPLSRDGLLDEAAESDLLWAPGTKYQYSNLGYSMLAAIIETVSGVGYEAYLAEHLFGPAGMTDTGYVLTNWEPDQVAVEYDRDGTPQGRPPDHPWDSDGPYWNLRGNGGILSTAQDMFRWHLALEGTDVLSTDAKAKLFEPHVLEDNGETHYGYGWVVLFEDDQKIVWHNGGNGRSFGDYLRLVDSGLMVFWVTNNVQRDGGWNLEDLELPTEIYRRLRDD